jgi:histidine triad (HIT) family protein
VTVAYSPVMADLAGAGSDPTCVFCRIVSGASAAHEVWRDDVAVAFLDSSPLFAGHTLVVPAVHVVTLGDLAPGVVGPFFERVQRIATVMPLALDAQGTFVANNNVVSQSVAHLHVHVVPRTRGDGLRGFFWPRRRYGEGEAEACATRLRASLATS